MTQDDGNAPDDVLGVDLDPQSRCAHYHSALDIVAIKFHCCGRYYACAACHVELAGHAAEVWPADALDAYAIRCGACAQEMTIVAYLDSDARCPFCGAGFNPRCALHHHLYFDVPPGRA